MSAILNTFKTKQPFILLFLPLILVVFWFKWFSNPVIDIYEQALMPLSYFLVDLFRNIPIVLGVLSIVFTLITSYLIYYIIERYGLLRSGVNLPSLLYILIVGALPFTIGFNPVVFSALFILIAFSRMLYAYNNHRSISCFFDAGFMIGIATGFYLNSLIFIIFILIAMVSISRFNFREFVVLLIGTFLPLLFIWTYYLYTDSYQELVQIISNTASLVVLDKSPSIYEWCFLGYIGLLFFVSLAGMFLNNPLNEVFDIKFFTILFVIMAVSVIMPIILYPIGLELIVISAIPLSFYIGRYFAVQKHKLYGDILLFLFLACVILLQFPTLLKMIIPYE